MSAPVISVVRSSPGAVAAERPQCVVALPAFVAFHGNGWKTDSMSDGWKVAVRRSPRVTL